MSKMIPADASFYEVVLNSPAALRLDKLGVVLRVERLFAGGAKASVRINGHEHHATAETAIDAIEALGCQVFAIWAL